MRDLRRPALASVLVLLLGCLAAPVCAGDKWEIDKSRSLDRTTLQPSPGKALIVFARSQVMGAAVKVKLYADGELQGFVQANTYVLHECDPGKHEFIVAAENAGFLEAEVEADRVYVVQVSIHMGALKARTHFETARPGSEALEEITESLSDLHPIETSAEGFAWAAEREADFQKTIAKFRAKGEEIERLTPADGAPRAPWAS